MPQSKVLIAQAIFLSGILFLLGGCEQSAPPRIETAPTLSVEELLTHPQTYAHTMVKAKGCFVLGLESMTLRPCDSLEPNRTIWIEDVRFFHEMQRNRLPVVPVVLPKGLEEPTIERVLFKYDERRNAEAWRKLTPSPDREQAVLEVVLLAQFEIVALQFPLEAQSGFGHLGAHSHELILADVLSNIPAQFSARTEQIQSSAAMPTTVCEIVEDALPFVGKKVRFSARYSSDGIERSVLTNPSCGRGIEPSVPDEVKQHPDIEALDRALGQGSGEQSTNA